MSIIKVVTSIFCCFLFFPTFGQNKKQLKSRPIAQLYTNAKKLNYPPMPQYFIEGYQSGCFYELYINGIMVFSHFENVGLFR